MKKDKAHLVAFIGVMFALIFVLFMLEGALSIVAGVSTCVLSLPVAIALSIYDDWKSSFIGGTLLGVSSCIFCLAFGWLAEANPLVCILPRTILGITAYWTYFGLSKLLKKAKHRYFREIFPASIAAVVGTLTNTVLYILAVSLFVDKSIMGAGTYLLQIAAGIYFPIEVVASFILVPVYVRVMQKVSGKFVIKKKPTVEIIRDENNQVSNDNLS